MKRRTVLGAGLAAVGALLSCRYLDNEPMLDAPVLYEEVICDLHAHPSSEHSQEEILEMLGAPGLVGLAARDEESSGKILTYEKALALLESRGEEDFYEITPGKLAHYREGYFARTQELVAGIHHLLAMGWEGGYFPNYATLEEAVTEIHAREGIVILNHPFVVDERKSVVRRARPEHFSAIGKAYQIVDEVEVHNASSIDFVFGMKEANAQAKVLARVYGHLGIATSDCHRELEQVKKSGIYVEKRVIEEEGMEGLKHAIAMGEFGQYSSYLSRWSFLKGMVIDQLRGK